MNKVIKDGMVGVLVSGGYGAGFSTWASEYPGIEFEPIVVSMLVDEKSEEEIQKYLEEEYPEGYWGGVEGLEVVWLKPGTEFKITEEAGAEDIEYKENDYWKVA